MASKSVAFLHFCARAGVSQKDKIEMITKVFCLSFAKQTSAHLLKVVLLFASFCLGACGGSSGAAGNTLDLGTGTQLQVLDLGAVPKSATASALAPDWWRGAFMQIYVRAYQDTDGDGKGDLKGLIQRLDYLQGLGVKGLWLLPITESSDRDHGYAVKNYRALEADYGSHADFDLLLSEAHKRGMGVILDFVINHSSNQHPLFLNSSSSAKNAQRDYFIWQTPKPTGWQIYGQDPWYASNWANGFYFAGFTSSMPDFNLRSSDVESFHHDNLRFWLNKGVDGFRFDAVGNLIENGPGAWEVQAENHVVMSKVRQTIMQYSQRFMVCEAPANSNAFAQADSCGSAFAFDLSGSVVGAAKGDAASIQKLADYYKTRSANLAPFVSNHDSFAGDRLWNQVQGNLAQYKMAAASYLLLPGTPFIYYGEEIGMASSNALSGDAALRTPMSWTADAKGFSTATPFRALSANVNSQNVTQQQSDSNSLYQHYKQLLALRNTQLALRSGTYEAAWALQKTMGFQRVAGAEKIMVVLNFDTQANALNVSNLTPGETWSPLLGTNATASVSSAGVLQLNLPAQSFAVFKKN
jgi:alpha-amylase